MGDFQAAANVKQATLTAVIHRADGSTEDIGVIAYYHKNPLRRAWHRLTKPQEAWRVEKDRRAVEADR